MGLVKSCGGLDFSKFQRLAEAEEAMSGGEKELSGG